VPHPRFSKLTAPRQNNILEAAAGEFAAHGYADASINRVLERAGISKSTAYYYFENKEDFFLTVVQHYVAAVGGDQLYGLDQVASLTADAFWPVLGELYLRPLLHSFDTGWPYGVHRVVRQLRAEQSGNGGLAALRQRVADFLGKLLERGQALGLIRTDAPGDQLLGWFQAITDANDAWAQDHWTELDRQALVLTADRLVDALHRLLSPHTHIELGGVNGH
jgi:AcrR family transcriptional regulator